MLEVNNLETGYGKKQVIFDISLNANNGEMVSIIGPNGAGKSTILKAISGLIDTWQGSILFNDEDITDRAIAKNIASGIIFCPQGNEVFEDMTVRENLEIGGYVVKSDILEDRIDLVLELFPELRNRLDQTAGTLSGGEQQMLALSRALIPQPKLLLLDEPSLGLAPNLLDDVFDSLQQINNEMNLAMLIVEQKVNRILKISDRVYSIKLGKLAYSGKASELDGNQEKLKELFL